MKKPTKDAGMIQLLLMRLNEDRLPRAMKLKEQVDKGECLTDYDMHFMKSVMGDASTVRRLAAKYPEYQGLVDKVAALYTEVTQKALENQQKAAERAKPY
jgi:hypothetical protein